MLAERIYLILKSIDVARLHTRQLFFQPCGGLPVRRVPFVKGFRFRLPPAQVVFGTYRLLQLIKTAKTFYYICGFKLRSFLTMLLPVFIAVRFDSSQFAPYPFKGLRGFSRIGAIGVDGQLEFLQQRFALLQRRFGIGTRRSGRFTAGCL